MRRIGARLAATAAGVAALVVGVPAIADLVSGATIPPQISLNTATPAFTVDGLLPGDSVTRCIRARNEGDADIGLTSTMAVTGALAPYLQIVAERGAGLGDTGPSCAGFVAAGTYAYGTQAAGVAASGLSTESVASLAPQATRSLRITLSLPASTAAEAAAKQATVTLGFAGTEIPSGGGGGTPAPGPSPTPTTPATPPAPAPSTTTARPPAAPAPAPTPRPVTPVGGSTPTPTTPPGGVATGTAGGYDINGNFLSNSTIKKRLRIGRARLRKDGSIVVRMFLPAGGAIRAKAILPNGVYYAHTLLPVEWGPTVDVVLRRRAIGRAAVAKAKHARKALALRITTRYRWAHGPHAFVQPEQKLVVVRAR